MSAAEELPPQEEVEVKIFVKSPTGQTWEDITVAPGTATLEDLEIKINERYQYLPGHQSYISHGRLLEAGIPLSRYDIVKNGTVYMVPNPVS